MVSLQEPRSPAQTNDVAGAAWKPRSALLGTLLANRYRVASLLGQGSTGAVYRAEDVLMHRPVAVRVLVPALAQQPTLITRIRARIEQQGQRDQEATVNLVDITDVGMTLEGEVFVVTDFLDGDHLATMLSRGGRLPWSRARSLLIRLAQILGGFHGQGIVVGTLEARHCFAVRTKAKQQAIKIVHNAILEHIAGTIGPGAGHGAAMLARYIAPERACGDPTDARTDVYSFGVIAFELLTGTLPFTDANPIRLVSMHLQKPPPSPRAVAPDAGIPQAVEAILLKCLAKEPQGRYASMETLTEALNAVSEHATDTSAAVVTPLAAAAEIAAPHAAPIAAAPIAAAPTTSPAPALTATPAAPSLTATPATATSAALTTPATSATPAAATPDAATPAIVTPVTPATPDAAATPVAAPPTLAAPAADHPPHLAGLSESGKLRLPPPPSLNRPPTLPPRGSVGTLPTGGVPTPAPRPPSIGLNSALPRPPTLPPTGAPTFLRPPSIPVPAASATPAAPVPSATPAATAAPVSSDSPAAPVLSATSAPDTAAAPAPSASPAAVPLAPPVAVETPSAPDTGKVTDSSRIRTRIAAYAAYEEHRGPPTKNPLRASKLIPAPVPATPAQDSPATPAAATPTAATPAAVTPAAVTPAAVTPAATPPAATPTPEPKPAQPDLRIVPPLAAADRVPEPVLAPAANDSLTEDVPRSRTGWLVGGIVGLVAAAGVAILVLTSPSFSGEETKTTPTKMASAIGEIPQPAKSTPTKIAEAKTPDLPERGTAVTPPEDPLPATGDAPPPADNPPTTDTAAATPPADTPPTPAVAEPDPAPTSSKSKKKDPKKKRRTRDPEDEEPREKDVFDQLREHMEAKKAAEAARAAGAQTTPAPAPQPAPQPQTPPPAAKSDADKARETLDRARQASSAGNPSLAYSLAKQSYNLSKTQDALELMGVAACRARNADNARSALGSLSGSRRNAVVAACTQSGITL